MTTDQTGFENGGWAFLAAVVVGWLFLFGIRLIYPALGAYVRPSFGISNSLFVVFTLSMVGYGFM